MTINHNYAFQRTNALRLQDYVHHLNKSTYNAHRRVTRYISISKTRQPSIREIIHLHEIEQ